MIIELEAYHGEAGQYDERTRPFRHWRDLVVRELPASPGDTVLDVGCGTGLCLSRLRDKVGAAGTVVGIDESEEMVALADERVSEHGWKNVRLVTAAATEVPIDPSADAAIFCAVHDVLQSPIALKNVFGQLRPGAPVAAVGGKWPAPWLVPFRSWVGALHAPFVQDFTGFDRPWLLLAEFVPDLQVREVAAGAGYLATGHVRAAS